MVARRDKYRSAGAPDHERPERPADALPLFDLDRSGSRAPDASGQPGQPGGRSTFDTLDDARGVDGDTLKAADTCGGGKTDGAPSEQSRLEVAAPGLGRSAPGVDVSSSDHIDDQRRPGTQNRGGGTRVPSAADLARSARNTAEAGSTPAAHRPLSPHFHGPDYDPQLDQEAAAIESVLLPGERVVWDRKKPDRFRVIRDAILRCHVDHPDVHVVPIDWPTAMVDWGRRERTVYKSLDAKGMRNPLVCYVEAMESWVPRVEPRRQEGVRPAPINIRDDGSIWLVKFGNQRLKWAELRGYTHVPVVVTPSEQDAKRWLVNYQDA